MTQPVAAAVSDILPPDDEMIIGTVTGMDPLTVATRLGTVDTAGRLSPAVTVGSPVAMTRQDSTWLVLGTILANSGTGLALTDVRFAASTAILGLTAADQNVAGTTVTFTTAAPAARIIAFWVGDFEVIAAATATGVLSLDIDGTTLTSPMAIYKQTATGDRGTQAQVYSGTVAPGDHTAVLRGRRVGGADGQMRLNNLHTTLLLAVLQ